MTLFDSHCHLDFPEFDHDRGEILEQCMNRGIGAICIPATEASAWSRVLTTVRTTGTGVRQFAALGLHPCFMEKHQASHLDALRERLRDNTDRIVAVGEIGLDFFNNSSTENSDREKQRQLLHQQLKVAKSFDLPVILHVRKAHDDALKLLRQVKLPRGGIVHAYSGSEQQAQQYIDLGFKLGFGGVITYPRARKTRQLAATLPLQSIVLETDSPDMPLSGHQEKRNAPTMIHQIAQELTQLRGEDFQAIARQTTRNCCELFDITLEAPSK